MRIHHAAYLIFLNNWIRGHGVVDNIKSTLSKARLLVCCVLCICLPLASQAADQNGSVPVYQAAESGNLSKQQVDALAANFAGKPYKNFDAFCLTLYGSYLPILTEGQRSALGQYAAGQPLSGPQREVIFRLLGLYAQLKYGGDALRSLRDLVAVPTVEPASLKQVNKKNTRRNNKQHFLRAAQILRTLAKDSGLKFRAVGPRLYEISFPWRNNKQGASVALHAHVDVVPADKQAWRLADGRVLNPFRLTRVDNTLYGRGAQSNKNAIVAAVYAMRVIVEENVRLHNNMVLVIGVSEKTTASRASRSQGSFNQGSPSQGVISKTPPKSTSTYPPHYAQSAYHILLKGNYPISPKRMVSADGSPLLIGQHAKPSDSKGSVNALNSTVKTSQPNSQQGLWLQALSAVASENLSLPVVNSGYSTGRPQTNVVEFGLTVPHDGHLGHNALEHSTVDQFLLDVHIITEMMARIGQMQRLD